MHDELMHAAFKRFDKDNSGYITKDDLKEAFGGSCSSEVAMMIQEVNQSNGEERISYQRFISYLNDGSTNNSYQEAAESVIDNVIEPSMEKQKSLSSKQIVMC